MADPARDPTLDDPTYVYQLNQALGQGNAPTPPWRYGDERDPYQPYPPRSLGADVQSAWQSLPGFLSGLRQALLPTPGESARQTLASLKAPEAPRPAMSGEATPVTGLADPVDWAAGALAPRLLPYARGVGEMFAGQKRGPSGRLSLLKGEAGNLGTVPVHATTGEPLPESVVRGARGNLTRVVHGTDVTFPDFDPNFYGRGAGGDLYGPGIYTSQAPTVTAGYAFRNWPQEAKDMLREIEHLHYNADWYGDAANLGEAGITSAEARETAQAYRSQAEQVQARLSRHMEQNPWLYEGAPQSRAVYLDIRNPFDIDAPISQTQRELLAQRLEKQLPGDAHARDMVSVLRAPSQGDVGAHVYDQLTWALQDKAATNQLLRDVGYDGITHWGGSGAKQHKVWIAFHPDQVYPAANVESLPGFKR